MSLPLTLAAFPVTLQNLYSAIKAGTTLWNTPAAITNGATIVSGLTTVLPLVEMLDPTATDFSGVTTDYTPDLLTNLTAAKNALVTANSAMLTHVNHQISVMPVLMSITVVAESIEQVLDTSLGHDTVLLNLTGIIRGSMDTIYAPITTALAAVNAVIVAGTALVSALITTLISAVNAAASAINTAVANEINIENDVNATVQAYGYANVYVGLSHDTGFMTLATAAGTPSLTSNL